MYRCWRSYDCVCYHLWLDRSQKSNSLAARTDDLLAIIELQFEAMGPGPKLIMDDFNGSLDAFPTAMALIREQGWTEICNDKGKRNGKPGRATCHTNANANESRIDFILANSRMTQAIVNCYVDENSDFPTHTSRSSSKLLRSSSKPTSKSSRSPLTSHVC